MHILLLTPSLPYPPHQGGALRNFGIIRGLFQAGHLITLVSFHPAGANGYGPLEEYCARIEIVPPPPRTLANRLRDLVLSGAPDLAQRLASDAMRAALRRVLSETLFDVIQFEGLEMAIYLDLAREMQPKARLIYDAHNAEFALQSKIAEVESNHWRRLPAALYSRIQSRRIYHFEREVSRSADAVIAVSEEDAAELRAFRSDGRVYVLPNGIFTDAYSDPGQGLDLGEQILVFTGKMDYRPNVDGIRWFVDSILPEVHTRFPEARLYIVGQKPHSSLRTLSEKVSVEVTGWVPEVQPFLHAADVYIAPLRMGSGTRLKIMEAMAAGCAVVATPIAAAGLTEAARQTMLIAEDENGFADAVSSLLGDEAKREQLGKAAMQVVRQQYDWSALIPCLLATYRELGLG